MTLKDLHDEVAETLLPVNLVDKDVDVNDKRDRDEDEREAGEQA